MSNIAEYARLELEAAGYFNKEGMYEGMLGKAVIELIEKFAEQGHSGMSATAVINVFSKLAKFEPLGPLTGEDDEWNELYDGVFQNKRCSRVFKSKDRFNGQAYDIDGKVFREPDGSCFTCNESFTPIEFPYTPTTEYVDVTETP